MKKLVTLMVVLAAALSIGAPSANADPTGNCTSLYMIAHTPISLGGGLWGLSWQQDCNVNSIVTISFDRHLSTDCSGCYYTVWGPSDRVTQSSENNVILDKGVTISWFCSNTSNYRLRIKWLDRNGVLQNDYAYTGTNACA